MDPILVHTIAILFLNRFFTKIMQILFQLYSTKKCNKLLIH